MEPPILPGGWRKTMYIHSLKLDNHNGRDFLFERPNGIVDYLYLVFKSPAILMIGAQVFSVSAPTAVLIDSHTSFKYSALSDEYEDDYFHFAVQDKRLFIEDLIFPFNTPVALTDYSSIADVLHLIYREYSQENETAKSREALASLTCYLMIRTGRNWIKMARHNKEMPHYDRLTEIRERIMSHPDQSWTINELAESVHLSPAYFQVLYRRTFGTTCINDVIDARISHAKDLLLSTSYSVNEISKLLGYNEVCHFIRQFKKHVGLSPLAFRKRM